MLCFRHLTEIRQKDRLRAAQQVLIHSFYCSTVFDTFVRRRRNAKAAKKM